MGTPSTPKGNQFSFANVIKRVPGGALMFAVIPLLFLGYFGWYYYGAEHLDHALYNLRLENLTVTDQPAWIKANVAQEVFRDSKLEDVSLLDPHATATIAQAFEAHHWVKSASRVTKSTGAKVAVNLIYRRPAAMVHLPNYTAPQAAGEPNSNEALVYFFPIDSMGVLLPAQDLEEQQVLKHFLIYAEDVRSAGEVGKPFGDARIIEALKLCEFLEPERERWGLERINVYQDLRSGGASPWILILATRDRSREIIWGHAPTNEASGEPQPGEKLTRLRKWMDEPSTGTAQKPAVLDLRAVATAAKANLPGHR
ncbi:hypothetical protein [Aureliella helgolandensis]|uniref:Cell division protein FtsQ n=1 Tax=Aureliella helgolandensis TaxID=2527968 RepID=A0A518G6L7_9BACT|nr:hypothetical protein [Aureliella helgolandensis]QDV24237.1 hypothetical protein Q31a_25520 [Aureliella helgolandensis]